LYDSYVRGRVPARLDVGAEGAVAPKISA